MKPVAPLLLRLLRCVLAVFICSGPDIHAGSPPDHGWNPNRAVERDGFTMDLTVAPPRWAAILSSEQVLPATAECSMQADQGGDQNRNLAGLNLLNRPGIQIGKFGESLLRHPARSPLPADAGTESLNRLSFCLNLWHAASRRNVPRREHGPTGREMQPDSE